MAVSILRIFKKRLEVSRKSYRSFLTRTEKTPPRGIDKIRPPLEAEVWAEVDCLQCANCCKKMTPTFTKEDITRISRHLEMPEDDFKKKWLKRDSNKDMVNVTQPCQFLDLQTNFCSIYEVRPIDCAGFPHLSKKNWRLYAHVYKQNIDYCPATLKMVEKLKIVYEGLEKVKL